MDRKRKNFFYRINPKEVLAELVFVDNKEQWLMEFLQDLGNDDAEAARSNLAREIIEETHGFRKKRSKAGKVSAQQKVNKKQHVSTYVEHKSTSVEMCSTSSSNSSSNKKIKSISPQTEKITFIEKYWCWVFQQIQGEKYYLDYGKDRKHIKMLLTMYENRASAICVRLASYLTDANRWPKDKSPTISMARNQIQNYPEEGPAEFCPPDDEWQGWAPWEVTDEAENV